MPKWRVLVVDDEPKILSLVEKILSSEQCVVETAADALLAWEKLDNPENSYSYMILDHQLPGMDGLELLHQIKADSRLRMMPVIMQSGAASPEQIAEGIEAGAFYYLTKPWVATALLCIVRSVLRDLELRAEAPEEPASQVDALRHLTSAELTFSTVEDVIKVAGILALLCPDPDRASIGLTELLLNAVEHGNLGISYHEKKELMCQDAWEAEVKRRLARPEYLERIATVSFRRTPRSLEFRITDQGDGFDWEKYLEIDPERSGDPNGRGIAMSRRYTFSGVEFQGTGNVVVATIDL